ncbi:MAG: hypothetical protein F4219_07790 [Gammaproteobacteria bacterium]|nr:hypothetical protein [Gammaproteobacteria bacterium]
MTKFLNQVLCGAGLLALTASVSVFAEIEGTYILEDSEESRFKWRQPELTIKADDEGQYSATLKKGSGEVLLETSDVEVDQREFKAVFTMSSTLGDLNVTFAGSVVDGKMTGTISESMFSSEVKLTGDLQAEAHIPHQEDTEIVQDGDAPVSDSSASPAIDQEIVGTFVLDSKSNSRRKPELTIDRDSDGEYSATLSAGAVTETDDVEWDGDEFSATFTISTKLGDMAITYAGRVDQGNLSGTITEDMYGSEVKLVGKLKNDNETNTID